jgi:hypothetical protein
MFTHVSRERDFELVEIVAKILESDARLTVPHEFERLFESFEQDLARSAG